ncbi:MAG: hypothetical protein HY909_11230 [Deltaproteobacteria bacterium]|nr:hypothetical protein [Deltaproteobacteria bacterium]
MKQWLWLLFCLLALALGPVGCGTEGGPQDFNDHTVPRLATLRDYEAIAAGAFGTSTAKFIITAYGEPARRDLRFYDGNFYTLHDQWYWFRLLNGAAIPGDDIAPVRGLRFATIPELSTWARGQPSLPLDLRFYEDRLYSVRFYDLSFGDSRRYGLGTLVRVPARAPNPERWAFELEYDDVPTHAQLSVFFELLEPRVPPEARGTFRFLVRSPGQEMLAETMERERLRYGDRILRYRDLVTRGAREVYSEGITAGRLKLVRRGMNPGDTTPEDVLVFENTPDLLPPCAGVITAVPQTPLAHVNLLARNRGIPNVHIAGILEDASVGQLERAYAPVLLFAEAPGRVVLVPITETQYQRYGSLLMRPARRVMAPPPESLPYTVDLTTRDAVDIPQLSLVVGGKASGMIALLREPTIHTPDRPLGITIRAYSEHLQALRPRIERVLDTEAFQRDARVRQLLLEGEAAYRARRTAAADLTFLTEFLRFQGPMSDLGGLARNGGLRGLVEGTPMQATTREELLRTFRETYRDLVPTQGLRFRSSSNVEDIEGFNGAGLYESFTGFLDPAAQASEADRQKSVERAILRVWGSFWAFESFEERRLERIDHLSGAMGVLVHPRFDDPLERATGVCTYTILPPGGMDSDRLEVNVQAGDQSVANPDPQVLPEVVRVLRSTAGALRFERVRRSTLAPDRALLSDDVLRRLFDDTGRVARAWLDRENAPRLASQRGRTLTLDFEFHDMLAGWPALRTGPQRPARMVLKQVRTLEPGARTNAVEAATWPVPRDIFVRARRVTTEQCRGEIAPGVMLQTSLLRVLTDSSLPPDVGFAMRPFDALLELELQMGALPAFGWDAGASYAVEHPQFTATTDGARRTYALAGTTAMRVGVDSVTLEGTQLTLRRGETTLSATVACRDEIRYAGARDFLLSLVPMDRAP